MIHVQVLMHLLVKLNKNAGDFVICLFFSNCLSWHSPPSIIPLIIDVTILHHFPVCQITHTSNVNGLKIGIVNFFSTLSGQGAPNSPSVEYDCAVFATNLLSVVNDVNALIESPDIAEYFDIINIELSSLSDINLDQQISDLLNDNDLDDISARVFTAFEDLECNIIGQIYFGIAFNYLELIQNAILMCGVVITLIGVLTLVLAFLGIVVNIRLGNDGVDVNEIGSGGSTHNNYKVGQAQSTTTFALEMTEPTSKKNSNSVIF